MGKKHKQRLAGPPKPAPAPTVEAPACSIVAPEVVTPAATDGNPTPVEPATHDDPPPRDPPPAVTEPLVPATTNVKLNRQQHGWGTTILCSLLTAMFALSAGMAISEARHQHVAKQQREHSAKPATVKQPTEAELTELAQAKLLEAAAREEDLLDYRAERARKRRRDDALADLANAELYRTKGLLPHTVLPLPEKPVHPEPAPVTVKLVTEDKPGHGAPPTQVPDPAPPEAVTPPEEENRDAVSELPSGSVPDAKTARVPPRKSSSRRKR